MQELSTAVQYRLPVKIFILNNQYMGMVRQWQELLHGGRYSQSYSLVSPRVITSVADDPNTRMELTASPICTSRESTMPSIGETMSV